MNNLEKEAANRKILSIVVYRVIDAQGTSTFLSVDALSVDALGGADAVKAMFAKQCKSAELMGAGAIAASAENPARWEPLDEGGKNPLWERLMHAMESCPTSSRCLEHVQLKTPPRMDTTQVKLRPMSALKEEVGNVDLERIAIAFTNRDVASMVKPEFVSIVRARGAARLGELKEEYRTVVGPSLTRALEGRTAGSGPARGTEDDELKG